MFWYLIKQTYRIKVIAEEAFCSNYQKKDKTWSVFQWKEVFFLTCISTPSTEAGGGGKLLPIHSLKWNPNDVLTTCKAISKGLASGFVYWSYALRQNPLINGLEKKRKHGGRRRDCFSLSYFGHSQIYWVYVGFQTVCGFLFLLNNFPLQSLEYATYSSVQLIRTAEELSYRAVFCCKP